MVRDDLEDYRRRELAQFLRHARARATPEAAGIAVTGRRRTAGLRREEVAELAGVSSIWYTWLEQARQVQPSDRLLGELAVALRLTTSEREYMQRLGREVRPEPVQLAGTPQQLQRLVADLPGPAMLADHRWNLVTANAELMVLVPGMTRASAEINIIRTLFLSSEVRRLLVERTSLVRAAVSAYHLSYARNVDDARLVQDIVRLRDESAEFDDLWGEHIIDTRPKSPTAIRHPEVGTIRFNVVVLRTFERREAYLVSLAPSDPGSAAAWDRLRGSPRESRARAVPPLRLASADSAAGQQLA